VELVSRQTNVTLMLDPRNGKMITRLLKSNNETVWGKPNNSLEVCVGWLLRSGVGEWCHSND